MPPTDHLFDTERLRVRRLDARDLDAMFAVYGDVENARYVGDGQPLDREGCERWVEVTLRNYETRGYGMFAVVSREHDEVVGFCGLVHPGGQVECEIKYALRRDCWGLGYATEAAAALLRHGATVFRLARVIATTHPDNTASHHVLAKIGMQPGALERNEDGSLTQLFVWTALTCA